MICMQDFFYPSCGKGTIHGCRWEPNGAVKGVVQIIHGIAEYAGRYDRFASYLNSLGYLVVAQDHMGHGQSAANGCEQGYFYGGWFAAAEDCFQLMKTTKEEFPDVPYILFGHSMGSFLARTLLITHPEFDLSAAIICGTGWMPGAVVKAGCGIAKAVCRLGNDKKPNTMLHNLMFGSYNKRIEHRRTDFDWLSRDNQTVDDYIADPKCGFMETAGLARDMLEGICFIQNPANLKKMNKDLPVYFIAGGDDPVGDYGAGVRTAAEKFRENWMDVTCRIIPLCRHEILNEINRELVFADIADWIGEHTK